MTPSLSLIVLLQGSRRFLDTTLASVAEQTVFDQTEVFIVDPARKDGSGAVADEFAAAHPNVTVLHLRGRDYGIARDVGLARVTTPWVAFLDSDDELLPDALQVMHEAALASGADLVVANQAAGASLSGTPWTEGPWNRDRIVTDVTDLPQLLQAARLTNRLFSAALLEKGPGFGVGIKHTEDYVIGAALADASIVYVMAAPVYVRRKQRRNLVVEPEFLESDTYFDLLTVSTALLERVAGNPVAENIVQRFLIARVRTTVEKAKEYLSPKDLARFLRKAGVAFASFDPQRVASAPVGLTAQVGWAGLLGGNPEAFTDPDGAITGLRVADGETLTAIVAGVDDPRWQGVATQRIVAIRARAEGLTVDHAGRARLWVGLALGRVTYNNRFADLSLSVVLAGTDVGFPLVYSAKDGRNPASDMLTFTADIDAQQLPEGQWPLELLIVDADGNQLRERLLTSNGMDASSRPHRLGEVKFQAFGGPDLMMWLRAARGKYVTFTWEFRSILRDLRAWRYREPFAGLKVLRVATRLFFIGRRIILIGERNDTAQDNGYHLFKAYRSVHGNKNVYYVIDKDSAQRDRVTPFGNVVAHGSRWHKLLVLHARTLVATNHVDLYQLPFDWPLPQYRRFLAHRLNHRRVSIRHGVILGNGARGAYERAKTGLDLLLTSAEGEKQFLEAGTGYDDEFALTGLARFDALTPIGTPRQVLIMPTWRRWLVAPSYDRGREDPGTFVGSEYELFYNALLSHPRLLDALQKYHYDLKFFPHYQVASYFSAPEKAGSRIEILAARGFDLQQTMRSSSLLVTDFSSVESDAAYLGIPVVYSQFDEEDFYQFHYRKGWFDTRTQGFGPVGTTVDEVVDLIIGYLERDCVREDLYSDRADEVFAFRDRGNTERIIERISQIR